LSVAEAVIEAEQQIVVIDGAVDVKIFRRQTKNVYFRVIDFRQVLQNS
jgi:hypothetical protein